MSATSNATCVIGVFSDRAKAERFVKDLHQAGFQDDQIGIASPQLEETADHTEEGAAAGVIAGGALGALAGAAATGLIPGVGPVIATGLMTGILGGAAAGATTGGALGALVGMGVPEDEAHHYESEFLAGRTLVVVQGDDGNLPKALAILRRYDTP